MCVFRLLLSDFKFIHWLSLHSGTTPNREPYRIPELTESGRPSFPGRMALGGGGRVGAGAWGSHADKCPCVPDCVPGVHPVNCFF